MSTPYGGSDPQQDPQQDRQQWGQQPHGDQAGGQQAGGVPAPGYGQPAQSGQEQWAQQPYGQPGQNQWAQQWQQYPAGYPQPGGTFPPSGPQPWASPGQPVQDQWGQQWQQPYGAPYGQPGAPGGTFPPSGQPGGTFPPSGQPGGFGQYPPGMEPEQQKKSKAPLFIGVSVLVLLIAVVAVLGFVAPGFFFKDKVFDAAAVEQGVEQILTQEDVEFDSGSASCPADQPVQQGHTFNCTVTIDGEQKDVAITVVDAEADPPKYQVETP